MITEENLFSKTCQLMSVKALVRNRVFPVNDGLEPTRLTYTISRMKALGLLKDQEPDLAQLLDRGPFMRVLGQLGTASQ